MYVRRHLGSFWLHLGPDDPRLKQVSRLFPDRVKPLLQIYWIVEPTVKWVPDSTRLLCSTFPGSVQDTTGRTKKQRLVITDQLLTSIPEVLIGAEVRTTGKPFHNLYSKFWSLSLINSALWGRVWSWDMGLPLVAESHLNSSPHWGCL